MSNPADLDNYVWLIGEAVKQFRKAASDQERRKHVAKIVEQATRVEHWQSDSTDMVDFFANVADGVVAAQGRLDALTSGYLRERERLGHSHAVPTAFRIDRAEAHLSFEFSEISKERVGLLFRRQESSTTQKTEHSVTFEVQAVPPPPEVRAELAGRPVTFAFDDGPAVQQRVLIAVAQAIARERELITAGGDGAAIAEVRHSKLNLWLTRERVILRRPGGYLMLAVDKLAEPKAVCVLAADDEGGSLRVRVMDEPLDEFAPNNLRESFFKALFANLVPSTPSRAEAIMAVATAQAAFTDEVVYESPPVVERPKRIRELLDAVDVLEQLYQPAGTDLSEFFDGVASALVQAQRGLDQRSRDYLEGDPFIPTTYRIPKVSAELSFAVHNLRRRRVNAILFGKEHRDAREREQRVKLDILAAPLDPTQASALHARRQQTFIAVLPPERERVRKAIAAAEHPNAKATKRAGQLTDDATFAKAMVLRHGRRYLVMAPAPDRSGAVIAAELREGLDPDGVHVGQTASDVPSSYGWLFEWWWPDYPRRDS